MAGSGVVTVYGNAAITETTKKSPFSVKVGLAQMLRGRVIMDVVNADQARIAEEAGACAVMALERVPADIRSQGGVARMSDPQLIKEIKQAITQYIHTSFHTHTDSSCSKLPLISLPLFSAKPLFSFLFLLIFYSTIFCLSHHDTHFLFFSFLSSPTPFFI
ncbi:probable pyridoxal 5'-phosphate synthase subunit PDX1 [Camellia sinensis]|uniref:probable pyridoxal 5'-phosphate synthase subunit PDX1 n=1 Tax=Camellia sinensis TaxID=4442 RepID=UPI00103578AA|nr:probable pyridoxal 5'-phosphate synthase subunit PDX1 [Camellia sinensis]